MKKVKLLDAPPPPSSFGTKVTLGANREAGQTVIIFGDPGDPQSLFFTFTPKQTRELCAEWLKQAEIAEGSRKAAAPMPAAVKPRRGSH